MKDNDIDNLLREKASQIDDGKYDFRINVDEIKRKAENKKKGKIIKISFASALAACLILGILFFISINTKPSDVNVILQGNDKFEDLENNNINNNEDLKEKVVYKSNYREREEIPSNVFIIKVNSVNNLGIIDDIPSSIISGEVIENFYGNLSGIIEIKINMCVCNFKDLPKSVKCDLELDDFEKVQIVGNDSMLALNYPKVEKYYLLSIDNNNCVLSNVKYPFYEYDPETKKVKIGDEWQDIDFNYIVW